MMYEEFTKIAGYRVSYDDYKNIIEPMYNATNLSKYEFTKTLNRKYFDVDEKLKERERLILNTVKAYNTAEVFSNERDIYMHELEYEIQKYIELVISMEYFCDSITYKIDLDCIHSGRIYRIVFFNGANGNYKFHFFFENNKIFRRRY